MRIITKAIMDIETLAWEHVESFEYSGEVSLLKGEGVAQQQMSDQNALVKEQLSQQKVVSDSIRNNFSQYLNGNGLGYSPEMINAANSQFMNQNTGAFQSAGQNVRAALASKGAGLGDLPVGGDFVRGIAELEGAKASSQSQGLLGLNIQNLQQGIQNKFNAGNLFSGQAAQFGQNIGNFNQGASAALGDYIKGANAPGFLSSLASGIGGGIGAGLTGGLGTFTSSLGTKLAGKIG